MSKTRVVNVKYDKFDEYIGRFSRCRNKFVLQSIFHNPYKIGPGCTRERVMEKCEAYLRDKIKKDPWFRQRLLALDGKRLGCWCKEPDREVPCHGDILVKLIAELKEAEHGEDKG